MSSITSIRSQIYNTKKYQTHLRHTFVTYYIIIHPRIAIGGADGKRHKRHQLNLHAIDYIARIASRTFFGASSNWSVSIEYEARPFVRERIAVE